MKLRSLQTKITCLAGLCLLLTSVLIVAYAVLVMWREAEETHARALEHAEQLATVKAEQYANSVQASLQHYFYSAQTLAQILAGVKDERGLLELGRDEVNGMLRDLLETSPDILGVGSVWEPNAFDGMDNGYQNWKGHDASGRFIPYWSRDADGRALLVPSAGYEREETGAYYFHPKQEGHACLLEPYLTEIQDHEELITTLTVPILEHAQFYGVVRVDFQLKMFQQMVDEVDSLYKGAARAAVISHDGTLVALTGRPELAGEFLGTVDEEFTEDIEAIQQGRKYQEFEEGEFRVYFPILLEEAHPWSIALYIPEHHITAEADQQKAQVIEKMAKMVGIGVFGLLGAMGLLIWVIGKQVSKPLNRAVELSRKIAEGEFVALDDTLTKDETGQLLRAMSAMAQKLRRVVDETKLLTQAVQEGRLDSRAQTEEFDGGWREVMVEINTMVEAFVRPIRIATDRLVGIAEGRMPARITSEYPGDFNQIKTSLNGLIDSLNAVAREIATLTRQIQEGRLDCHGNVEAFHGDWRQLIEGLNALVEAFRQPIFMTAESLGRIARGDLPEPITAEFNGDFDQVKQNLNQLIEAMHAIVHLAQGMASGNFAVDLAERSEHDALMQALGTMTLRLRDAMDSVKTTADYVAANSQQIRAYAEHVSEGTTKQAATAEEVSTSMEQMAANVSQAANNAAQTEEIAWQAAKDAKESGQAVMETVSAMRQIVETISVIEEIANQTRLLSLNATIEAARADDHGKAFSVVASEVRALAERSQNAAEKINHVASSSIKIAENAGEQLSRLVPDIQKTAQLVQEIRLASDEQNAGAMQINLSLQELDKIIQQHAALSEEMASTAEESSQRTMQLQEIIRFFYLGLDEQEAGRLPSQTPGSDSAHVAATRKPKEIQKRILMSDEENIVGNTAEYERF